MEVFRLPPYPIVTTWSVPDPNTAYSVYVEDLVDHSIEESTITSNSSSNIEYTIPRSKIQFDRKFLFRVTDSNNEIVVDDNLDILRPYVDPYSLANSASEQLEYKKYEVIARSIIDTLIIDGFYNHKSIIQTTGTGSDYFPLWKDVNKVLKVYENNRLVYDIDSEDNEYTYVITLDNSAVQRVEADRYNRSESIPISLPVSPGNIAFYGYPGTAFPLGYDYTFIVDSGYKTVPTDIETATKILIDDLKCGKLDYFKRYVTLYSTDQFKMQLDKSMFNGTGNLVVDRILEKYIQNITKVGII